MTFTVEQVDNLCFEALKFPDIVEEVFNLK